PVGRPSTRYTRTGRRRTEWTGECVRSVPQSRRTNHMDMTETGRTVYQRTYSRTKHDGTRETWPETVRRVVDGNLALGDSRHDLPGERANLICLMPDFKV